MGEIPPEAVAHDNNWFVLIDPGWDGTVLSGPPPVGAVVGGWELRADGRPGPFRPNPHYRPSGPDVPTDPLDAVLRRIAAGEPLGTDLLRMLRESVVEIGCDESGHPLPGRAPDKTACVVVATAELQKDRIDVDRWLPIQGRDLPAAIPPGMDVLFNPAGAAPLRLHAAALSSAPVDEENR
ncbi:type VII secretion system-associated protein [Nocardia sp. NPDC003963]